MVEDGINGTKAGHAVESWLEAGCRAVLVADPSQRTVTVYRPLEDIRIPRAEAGDVLDGGDVVPGWKLSLGNSFA